MSLSYLILSHSSQGYVRTLLDLIYDSNSQYVVHADAKSPASLMNFVENLPQEYQNISVLNSRLCSWGGFSLVEVALEAITNSLRSSSEWTHFIMLSEQHLPLWDRSTIEKSLESGVSYLDAVPVDQMYPSGRADVYHRFAGTYEELPGVGMFACGSTEIRKVEPKRLHHGSQWMILSRQACKLLAKSLSSGIWSIFRHSLIADETAIQTVLMDLAERGETNICSKLKTFLALPNVTDNPDMIFNDENFFTARDRGFLFIRKRPAKLPESVSHLLKIDQKPGDDGSCNDVQSAVGTAQPQAAAFTLCEKLKLQILPDYPDISVEIVHSLVYCPDIYLMLRESDWPGELFVVVLSQDSRHFRTFLLWQRPFTESLAPVQIGSFTAIVIKPRVYGLFCALELRLPSLPACGFVTVQQNHDFLKLGKMVRSLIAAGRSVAMETKVKAP